MVHFLRDYQLRFRAEITEALERFNAVLCVCPTGGGKTVVFSSIIADRPDVIEMMAGRASAAIAHRREIVGQISLALGRAGVKHRVVAPPDVVAQIRRRHLRTLGVSFVDQTSLVGVASVQALTSQSSLKDRAVQSWVAQTSLVIFDEGHHYVRTGTWGRAVDMFVNAKKLFFTATPERADGQGLGVHADGYCEALVEGPTPRWLLDAAYWSPFKYLAPQSDLDVSTVAVTKSGDFNARALRERVVESHLVGDVVSHYLRHAKGRKAIVFATDVQTAEEMARAFVAAGVRAAALSGDTDSSIRDKTIDDFAADLLDVLVNVGLFDEGFDVPAAEVMIDAQPTESLAKFLQKCGRVMRPVYAEGFDLSTVEGRKAAMTAGPKQYALIIDPVRNWERHGLPDWPRVWTLDGKERKASQAGKAIPLRSCSACTQPYERFYTACPYCGHVEEPAGRKTPEQVDGDLLELDVDALSALFASMQRANQSDRDYEVELIGRGVPSIGRPRLVRLHRENRERRGTLDSLMQFWFGTQPADRSLSEKHRRFYHRFGVDALTALTLDAHDTAALIERISALFDKDTTPC